MKIIFIVTLGLLIGLTPLWTEDYGVKGAPQKNKDAPKSLQKDEQNFESDTFTSSLGDFHISFIGHASLIIHSEDKVIHIDPYSKLADYSLLPKADLILITHEHRDHLDKQAIEVISQENTTVIINQAGFDLLKKGRVLNNGETFVWKDIKVEAVPAYNLVHKRDNGEFFHPKGRDNGYILHWGDQQIYTAGDTENIPEMKNLPGIDIAFLPMNLPYTMTPEMTADAARMLAPRIFYPYHYGKTDPALLVKLLQGEEMEIRIRSLE